MNSISAKSSGRPCWFVGAAFGGTRDQTQRFLQEGIWVNNDPDKYLDTVKSIQVGDRIAIKSSYVRKHGLPFDNRGFHVSVMAIKAIGTVKENLGDGHTLKVDWKPVEPPREWYFYTNRRTVWQIMPGDPYSDALIEFTFAGKEQDIDWFRNQHIWRERFGDKEPRFKWTKFYEAFADKLLTFKDKREELISGIHSISPQVKALSYLQDHFKDGTTGPLKDICPFTVMGMFNRGVTNANRKIIAAELANLLGVSEAVPDSFEGIPVLNNQNSWFFGFEDKRQPEDIDTLWDVFTKAIEFADSGEDEARSAFIEAYDRAAQGYGVGWNLSIGLYWIRPWKFPTLDFQSQDYISSTLKFKIGHNGPKKRCSGNDYIELLDNLEERFQEESFPVHSFPELSYEAYGGGPPPPFSPAPPEYPEYPEYYLSQCAAETCFDEDLLAVWVKAINRKGQAIFYGPPGTGKTFIAEKLGRHLVGGGDGFIETVQFHPEYAYQDFMQGIRPKSREDGGLEYPMVNGRFLQFCENAAVREDTCVLIIDEINRANLARVFGELMYLLEYRDKEIPLASGDTFSIPPNVRIIGTMNTADRSIALVDFALRRRFACIELYPNYDIVRRFHERTGFKTEGLIRLLEEINNQIGDRNFSIGPSFFLLDDVAKEIEGIWRMEIGPYLEEYFFDQPDKAKNYQWKKVKERILG